MSISDDWSVPCYGDDAEFEPAPDELDAMYKQLEAGEVLEIGWKCAGRRPPTPIKVVTETKEKTKAKKDTKDLEFDFNDDEAAPTMQRVRGPASKTSTKKKTASFANVLNTIKKNRSGSAANN